MPLQLHKARGTYRADRHAGSVQFAKVRPRRPQWLQGNARFAWDRLAPVLFERGLLTEADRDFLAIYCQSYADLLAAEKEIRDRGQIVETPRGLRPNPAVRIMRDAAVMMDRFGAKFGLSPSDRTGLKASEPQQPANGKSRFFK